MATLREALQKRLSTNPAEIVKKLKSSGVMLSKDEETMLSQGSLKGFSDQALSQRFNAKVLGMLHINLGEESQGGRSGSSMNKPMMGKEKPMMGKDKPKK